MNVLHLSLSLSFVSLYHLYHCLSFIFFFCFFLSFCCTFSLSLSLSLLYLFLSSVSFSLSMHCIFFSLSHLYFSCIFLSLSVSLITLFFFSFSCTLSHSLFCVSISLLHYLYCIIFSLFIVLLPFPGEKNPSRAKKLFAPPSQNLSENLSLGSCSTPTRRPNVVLCAKMGAIWQTRLTLPMYLYLNISTYLCIYTYISQPTYVSIPWYISQPTYLCVPTSLPIPISFKYKFPAVDVYSKQLFKLNFVDSNCRPLVLEATALPTEPQPLPII